MFEAQNDQFLAHYHKRSNVETVFSAIKRKFGASVRAKAAPAQINHELKIDPALWMRLKAV
jgi:transposase